MYCHVFSVHSVYIYRLNRLTLELDHLHAYASTVRRKLMVKVTGEGQWLGLGYGDIQASAVGPTELHM